MADLDAHSFGPTCQYYEESPGDHITYSTGPPSKVRAQFFYASSVPIDDPLSPIPPVQSEKASKNAPPQPFTSRDNAALEEAWQSFQLIDQITEINDGKTNKNLKERPKPQRMVSFPKFNAGETGSLNERQDAGDVQPMDSGDKSLAVPALQQGNSLDNMSTLHSSALQTPYENLPKPPAASSRDEVRSSDIVKPDIATELKPGKQSTSVADRPRRNRWFSSEASDAQVLLSQDSSHGKESSEPIGAEELHIDEPEPKTKTKRKLSPFRHRHREKNLPECEKPAAEPELTSKDDTDPKQTVKSGLGKLSDISGRPFARAPSNRNLTTYTTDGADDDETTESEKDGISTPLRSKFHQAVHPHPKEKEKKRKAYVPVGVSRLHLVELPKLVMKPIYWSPVNDKAAVTRATWFYRDSMEPVDAETANRLEIGYETIRPFSESYIDELNACVENGAAAEMKVVYKLYPKEEQTSRPVTSQADDTKEMENDDVEPKALLPENICNAAADTRPVSNTRSFATSSVIFINEKDAQILKPSSLPNESRNRKPLKSIRKGHAIGVPVVRGFDRKAWDKLHPSPTMTAKIAQARVGGYMAQSGDATTRDRRASCVICDAEDNHPKVTDLVLVIHGIGQKLSERVDSFHFTHAVNGLRREFNVEQAAETVRGNLRPDASLMVLPVNWRLTLSFDDDEPELKQAANDNNYSLKDITPETLPAVRSLITDVMLDIPYYLSHHRETMTSAVVTEANRVYRLWCRNNPGFQQYGKVHLIAHSLGSAMAMDILSQQPTAVPRVDFAKQVVNTKSFEFDTKSLFCCGSPSGFFLLLNKANLLPRKGRCKTGMKGEDIGDIAGEAGTFGCLAVDNIYNIIHKNDPIAYQQNACVDSDYAASLVPATIPTASVGVFAKVGASLRLTSAAASTAYQSAADVTQRPNMQSMPSTVEMDTHNFTREEIAEKRMYLLNENGQIDYFLNSGGGPLEIQYINMLSAHSSYWLLQDFVRFCVLEVGRESGKDNTIPILRAQKKREFKRGMIA